MLRSAISSRCSNAVALSVRRLYGGGGFWWRHRGLVLMQKIVIDQKYNFVAVQDSRAFH